MNADGRDPTWLDLYDWRQRVAAMYAARDAATLAGDDGEAILRRFRGTKDDLFAGHPQSPLGDEARRDFAGLRYFPYAPLLRVEAEMAPVEAGDSARQPVAAEGMQLRPAARACAFPSTRRMSS